MPYPQEEVKEQQGAQVVSAVAKGNAFPLLQYIKVHVDLHLAKQRQRQVTVPVVQDEDHSSKELKQSEQSLQPVFASVNDLLANGVYTARALVYKPRSGTAMGSSAREEAYLATCGHAQIARMNIFDDVSMKAYVDGAIALAMRELFNGTGDILPEILIQIDRLLIIAKQSAKREWQPSTDKTKKKLLQQWLLRFVEFEFSKIRSDASRSMQLSFDMSSEVADRLVAYRFKYVRHLCMFAIGYKPMDWIKVGFVPAKGEFTEFDLQSLMQRYWPDDASKQSPDSSKVLSRVLEVEFKSKGEWELLQAALEEYQANAGYAFSLAEWWPEQALQDFNRGDSVNHFAKIDIFKDETVARFLDYYICKAIRVLFKRDGQFTQRAAAAFAVHPQKNTQGFRARVVNRYILQNLIFQLREMKKENVTKYVRIQDEKTVDMPLINTILQARLDDLIKTILSIRLADDPSLEVFLQGCGDYQSWLRYADGSALTETPTRISFSKKTFSLQQAIEHLNADHLCRRMRQVIIDKAQQGFQFTAPRKRRRSSVIQFSIKGDQKEDEVKQVDVPRRLGMVFAKLEDRSKSPGERLQAALKDLRGKLGPKKGMQSKNYDVLKDDASLLLDDAKVQAFKKANPDKANTLDAYTSLYLCIFPEPLPTYTIEHLAKAPARVIPVFAPFELESPVLKVVQTGFFYMQRQRRHAVLELEQTDFDEFQKVMDAEEEGAVGGRLSPTSSTDSLADSSSGTGSSNGNSYSGDSDSDSGAGTSPVRTPTP